MKLSKILDVSARLHKEIMMYETVGWYRFRINSDDGKLCDYENYQNIPEEIVDSCYDAETDTFKWDRAIEYSEGLRKEHEAKQEEVLKQRRYIEYLRLHKEFGNEH